MRFIPTRIHGILDYVVGIILIVVGLLVGPGGHSIFNNRRSI